MDSHNNFRIAKLLSKNIGFYNGRRKIYPLPDGTYKLAEICVFSGAVYNADDLESVEPRARRSSVGADQDAAQGDGQAVTGQNNCSHNSVVRARKRLYDLVACNSDCNMMATLTLNGADFPRDDWNAVIRKFSTWLDNMTRRHGLKYIFVPEYHKDGKSIHFHGFVNESALKLVRAINPKTDKPIFHNGRAVYNIANWKYGFTTAVRVGKSEVDQTSSAKYVLKYVTKNTEKIGGRYYLHGGDLREPIFEYFNTDFAAFQAAESFEITRNLSCKIVRGDALKDVFVLRDDDMKKLPAGGAYDEKNGNS